MPRPKLILIEELERLASLQCTQAEIATYFGVMSKAVEKALTKPQYREAYERGIKSGLISLRRAQFKAALAGNPTMLIWLGKQLLGQKDRHEVDAQVNAQVRGQFGLNEPTDAELLAIIERGEAARSSTLRRMLQPPQREESREH
jgi:hypothetical protein